MVTTAGDLLYATAADTVTRLGIGTAGQVLKVNSGATAPEWGTAGGGGKVLQVVQGTLTSTFSTTGTTPIDTGLTVSITPSSATSKVMIFVAGFVTATRSGSVVNATSEWTMLVSSTVLQTMEMSMLNIATSSGPQINGALNFSYLHSPSTTSATTYKVQGRAQAGGGTTTASLVASATGIASIVAMEIGA